MASKVSKVDQYSNVAAIYIQESAANTQTSAKFAFPFSIMDKMALVIQRLEYIIGNTPGAFNGSTDLGTMALTAAATIVNIWNQADPLMIDSYQVTRVDIGAAATGFYLNQPYVKDFTNLAGGGLLVAPSPLYGMIQGSGCAAALNGWIKVMYTYLELNSDEYWQLVESRRIISG